MKFRANEQLGTSENFMHLHNNKNSDDYYSLSGERIQLIFSEVDVNDVKFCCR